MNMILRAATIALLLLLVSLPCFASMEIHPVSKERAKALGIDVRTKPNGPGAVWIEVEFKVADELKGYSKEYSRVQLDIVEGGKSRLTAWLREEPTSPGKVLVRFNADRAQLDRLTLTVVVGGGLMPGGGYVLSLKDFVEVEHVR